MNDQLHPNHPDYVRHDERTGEVDEDVTIEIMDPISVGALATLQRVEIDQQVTTAKAYPRHVSKIKQELTALVTMDEETADDCIYALPRGNKHIKGPSARFADALISFWGNARSGAFITQVNREEKFVEAIGSFQDVERNVIRQRRVRRPIADRHGRIYNSDMINMTGNAACVIAERNAILNGIPKSLWSGAYDQAFALVAGTTKTLAEKLERATKAFALHNINMEQILEKLGYQDISKIVPDDIVTMRGMLTALKDGTETVETIFGRGAGGHQHETVQNPLKDDPKPQNVESGGKPAAAQAEPAANTTKTATVESGGKPDPISSGPQRTEAASNDGAKSDKATEVTGKATGEAPSGAAAIDQPAEKTAQAASPAPAGKQYDDAEGYMTFMRDTFDRAKSKALVDDTWRATRADRNEFLSPEQIDELTKDKEAKLKSLKLKGGDT